LTRHLDLVLIDEFVAKRNHGSPITDQQQPTKQSNSQPACCLLHQHHESYSFLNTAVTRVTQQAAWFDQTNFQELFQSRQEGTQLAISIACRYP
jgi:hypothetical protein